MSSARIEIEKAKITTQIEIEKARREHETRLREISIAQQNQEKIRYHKAGQISPKIWRRGNRWILRPFLNDSYEFRVAETILVYVASDGIVW